MSLSKRKRISKDTEADVLDKSGRRCCICFGSSGNFNERLGQIAHLDHDPSNSKLDNLCWLCLEHHDIYDSRRSQSKGYTITEVKRYRTRLYEHVTSLRESIQYINNFPAGADTPLLDFYDEPAAAIEKTSQGTQIIERQAGIRLSDKDLSQKNVSLSLVVTVTFTEEDTLKWLTVVVRMPLGFSFQITVCSHDDWATRGFRSVLRNKSDIWVLRGKPVENDARDPIYHARDSLLIYRKADGENRLVIGMQTMAHSTLQIHARFSEKVAEGFANYLEKVGFVRPA